MNIWDRVRKYIPAGESILSGIASEPFWGSTTRLYVATEQRLGYLVHKGWFSWHFESIGWEKVSRITIQESVMKCTIDIFTDIVDERTGNPIGFRIRHANKKDGRHFISVATRLTEEHKDLTAYRTKTCPQCDEVVKWRAKKCKHCGYEFV